MSLRLLNLENGSAQSVFVEKVMIKLTHEKDNKREKRQRQRENV